MIVYFTGTGNSRYCAQMIADHLDDQVLDSRHYIQNQIAADLVSEKPWVFVSPTYAWQLPNIFAQFIRTGCFHGNTDAYFVMTCGEDVGAAAIYAQRLCIEAGLQFKGVLPVVMPENYVAMFPVPDAVEAEEIILRAEPVLQKDIEAISCGCAFPDQHIGLKDRMKSGIVHDFFCQFLVKAKPFYVTDACVGCGKCAEACVLRNISIQQGKPVWGSECTHCMACICGCPTEAIEYGTASLNKPRYRCKEYKRG